MVPLSHARDGLQAWQDQRDFAYWPNPSQGPNRYLPDPQLHWRFNAPISPQAKVATMGSCFARNVELAFKRMGFEVISAFVPGLPYSENITNKYVIGSMINDVETLLSADGMQGFDADHIEADAAGGLVNLSLGGSGALIPRPRGDLDDLMRRYFGNLSQLIGADLVFIFLENTEQWWDVTTGRCVNIQPSQEMCARHPGRFEVRQLGLAEVLAQTNTLIARLRAYVMPTARLVLAVSPVPPARSFSGLDAMIDYSKTKAILRLVADELMQADSNLEYLPIFERLTLVAPERRWIPQDYRHMQYLEVERALRQLLAQNLLEGDFAPEKEELLGLFRQKNFVGLVERVEATLLAQQRRGKTIHDQGSQVRYYYALALINLGRSVEAYDILINFLADTPNHPAAAVYLARLHLQRDEIALAHKLLDHVLARHPDYIPAQRLLVNLPGSF